MKKWMYRKHPAEGYFQPTLVTTEQAARELAEAGWTDDPTEHGFDVRPASQMHHSHAVSGLPLHEVVPSAEPQTITSADIAVVTAGDVAHG